MDKSALSHTYLNADGMVILKYIMPCSRTIKKLVLRHYKRTPGNHFPGAGDIAQSHVKYFLQETFVTTPIDSTVLSLFQSSSVVT
jgi:hypothetical protein